MINLQTLNELAERLAQLVPSQSLAMQEDLAKSFHVVLQASLAQLHLVTREEFDVQRQILLQTRKQLDLLVAKLEVQEQQGSSVPSERPSIQ